MMNEKGQCCGRKPLVYKRDGHYFCIRCDRAYRIDTRQQINNWAWKFEGGQWHHKEHGLWVPVAYPMDDYSNPMQEDGR